MSDLILEGDPELLEELRREIEANLGKEAALESVTSVAAGEFREPLLIGLVVALGGPALIRGVVDIIDRVLTHKERMAALQMKIQEDDAEQPVTLDELRARAA